jgi:hypothetical protein
LKTTTRLSFLLLIAVLSIGMLGRTQEFVTSAYTTVACPYKPRVLLQRQNSTVALPDPRNLFRGSRARDKSILWKVHLALQLVKRPELNERQVRIILDAISLSTPEFFAAGGDTPAKKFRADEALASLKRGALGAFPNGEAAELFATLAGEKTEADILKMYYDISALPLKKRRASFINASANDKSDLWRTHLALFLVKRPDLNERQIETILAALSLTTPEYFEVLSNDPAWKEKVRDPSRALEGQIITAFPLEEAAKIFATLGDDAELAKRNAAVLLKNINYRPLSDSGPYKQWSHSRLGQQHVEPVLSTCDCSTQSDYCPAWNACGGGSCNSTQRGCGTLWSYPCNGACQ